MRLAEPPLFRARPENGPLSQPPRSTVIFDLGGVLIDWNPRHLYRKLFPGDEAAMERFLAEVCNDAWNVQQDAGRPFAEAIALLKARHPDQSALIEAYWVRWVEMLAGPIHGTVDILAALRQRRIPLYALTNWSAETWPIAKPLFPFLDWFDGIVVSGQERMAKPDPRLFRLLFERFALAPEAAIYIDDSRRNVEAAIALGLHAIHFTGARQLADELAALALLPAAAVHQK